MLLRLAIRNLIRNLRRSLITGSAITLGLILLIFAVAGTDGQIEGMIRKGTGALGGHVVVQAPGWQESRDMHGAVPDTPTVEAILGEAVPDALIVKRVFLEGLLTSPHAAVGVGLTGVEPSREAKVNDLVHEVIEGSWLSDDDRGILLGSGLAESLDVELGDKVVLMIQGEQDIESRLFRVSGIFETGVTDIDGFSGQITLDAARELLGLGSDATQLSLHFDSADRTIRGTEAARRALDGRSVEVLPWPEALPQLADYVSKEQTDLWIIFPAIWLMVALGIANTMLMSALERTHEFGVMRAIGMSSRQTAALVLTEAAVLGAVAAFLGWVLGWALIAYLAVDGIDLSGVAGSEAVETAGVARDLVLHPAIDPLKWAGLATGAASIAVLAALYPAWSVARLTPVDALRTV